LSQAAARFHQTLFQNNGDVFGARGTIGLQTGFSRGQKDMRGEIFVDARSQWHHKHGVGAFVAIARVKRHNDYGPPTLAGRIDM